MTSLNLGDRDRIVERDEDLRRGRRTLGDEGVTVSISPKVSEIANVIYKLGLPSVLVVWLIYFITSGLANDVRAMGEDHRVMRSDAAAMREDHRLIGRYLRAICEKLPAQRGQADPCYTVRGPIE